MKKVFYQKHSPVSMDDYKDFFKLVSICHVCSRGNLIYVERDPSSAVSPKLSYNTLVYLQCRCGEMLLFVLNID